MSTSFVPLKSVRLYVTSRISHSLSDLTSVRGSESARGAPDSPFGLRIPNFPMPPAAIGLAFTICTHTCRPCARLRHKSQAASPHLATLPLLALHTTG